MRALFLLAACLALASCATMDPVAWRGGAHVPAGMQELHLETYGYTACNGPTAWAGVGVDTTPGAVRCAPGRLDDVACTLQNERGAWNATAPGSVVVELSESKLVVRCQKPGYRPEQRTLYCVSPRFMYTASVLQLNVIGLPLLPGALAVPQGDGCYYTYGHPIQIYLTPELALEEKR